MRKIILPKSCRKKLQCVTETLGADWRQEVNFVSRGLRNRPGVLLYRKRIFYKGRHSHWILIDETHREILSISQFQLRPLPLPRATAGHWPALSVPGVGHLQILCCPGDGHVPTPRFWHADDFTGKTRRLAHLSRTGIEEDCKGMFSILCMHFFIAYQARITHERNSGAIDVNQRLFGYWIKFPLILFEEHPFILKP